MVQWKQYFMRGAMHHIHKSTASAAIWLLLSNEQRLAFVRVFEAFGKHSGAWTLYFMRVHGLSLIVDSRMEKTPGRHGEKLRTIELRMQRWCRHTTSMM